jgi:hypothetical protein
MSYQPEKVHEKHESRKMDWHLLWTALGVIIPVMGSIFLCFFSLQKDFFNLQKEMSEKFSAIEKDMTIIKTVLIMKGDMPKELAKAEEKK